MGWVILILVLFVLGPLLYVGAGEIVERVATAAQRPSFRLVYPITHPGTQRRRWHWHANMTHRNTPPRSWTNRAGNSRWKLVAWAKAWAGWLVLRMGVER